MKGNFLKPNILLIGNPHSNYSTAAFLRKFLSILSPLCCQIYVLCGDDPIFYPNCIWIKKIRQTSNRKVIRIITYAYLQIEVVRSMLTTIKQLDIIILLSPLSIIPLIVAKVFSKKAVIYAGGSASKNFRFLKSNVSGYLFYLCIRSIEYISFSITDLIIVESYSSIKFENLSKFVDKIVISGLFVDTFLFEYNGDINSRGYNIGYVGILDEKKGILNFVNALPSLIEIYKDAKVYVIGDGPLRDKINDLISENNLSDNVIIKGWIPHETLQDYLKCFKLLVIPSYTEGLPNVILEAMACGTLVLASHVGGIPDVIKNSQTGFIMEDNSSENIYLNIISILAISNLQEITCNARKLIEDEYSHLAATKRYLKILAKLRDE